MEIAKVVKHVHLKGVIQYFWQYSVALQLFMFFFQQLVK